MLAAFISGLMRTLGRGSAWRIPRPLWKGTVRRNRVRWMSRLDRQALTGGLVIRRYRNVARWATMLRIVGG